MVAQKNKKQGTKGSKQIIEENDKTIILYRNMCLGVTAIYFPIMLIFFSHSFSTGVIVMLCITFLIHIVCHNLLKYAAKITYSEDGKVVDCGTDLNMQGGVAEHITDMIILTAGTQLLSIISNYFWILLLLAPCRALFVLWKSVLGPWFFQPAEEKKQPDVEEKRQKRHKYTVN